ncbi:hypothetical protein ABPG75_006103 [Micractinium tetrahymenae]
MSAEAQQQLTAQLLDVLQSQWNDETYTSYYDDGWCINQNVTYSHRVNAEDNFNFCSVPLSGADAFLFAALALLVASVCMGKLQSVWVLIVGGCLGILNYEVNLYRLGNAISLWLGIQPPDLFFYAFLPPLLVDAALRLDWFVFTKLWPHIVLLAYGMVVINAAVLTPFILFVLGFTNRGWSWIQGAVLAAMLAPTDAVAVTAILKAGGGPENMVVLMEGEALLNDASAVTLYTVFLHILERSSPDDMPSVPSQIWPIIRDILKLTGIGVGLGLAFAWALGYVLKLLRWRGARPYIESLVVLATAYLTFYGPAKGSGVIAVCIFGLYGSATGHWGMLATDAGKDSESGIHEAVWDTVAFAANALVFFWSGISSVNFVARSAGHLNKTAWNYGAIPVIFLFMYAFRGACMLAFNPIFKLLGTKLSLPDIAFATVAGLRGSLTLIMAADFIIHSDFYSGGEVAEANFDVVLWASAFVLLSLLINAPSIDPVMRWTGLSRITPEKVVGRRKALEELQSFTARSIDGLKEQQDGEFLQGANWPLVAAFVDHTTRLKGFVPRPSGAAAKRVAAEAVEAEAAAPGPAAAAAAEGLSKDGADAAGAAGLAGSRKGSQKTSFMAPEGADDYEVPFLPSRGGAAAPQRQPEDLARALNVSTLQTAARANGSLRGSFYDPNASAADVAAAAAGTAAAAAVKRALAAGAGSFRQGGGGFRQGNGSFRQGGGSFRQPTDGGSTAGADAEEEEVELLFSQGQAGADLDALFSSSSMARAPAAPGAAAKPASAGSARGSEGEAGARGADERLTDGLTDGLTADEAQQQLAATAGAAASQAAAALVRRQINRATTSRAAAAGVGSTRDLLGRLQAPASRQAEGRATLVLFAAAATGRSRSEDGSHAQRDLEAGSSPEGDSSKAEGSAADEAEEGLQELRLRVLTGMKRHFRAKRLAGLLSPDGLRVANYACDKAIEHAEEHPRDPMRLWQMLCKEISGTWVTHGVAGVLAATLRLHRSMPAWWRRTTALPFRLFTGLLRKHLGSKMLVACEVTVELYMGLAASPQIQWVYFEDETPVAILEEVQAQLLGAYEYIQDREAEAPAQYRAVQSYRAAMAVLRQQRAFTHDMYERGVVDEDEREALAAAVDAAMRHLDMAGPSWRPPGPEQVMRSMDPFKAAPPELIQAMLRLSKLKEYRPGEVVWTSDAQRGGAGGGLFVVLFGVVRQEYAPPAGSGAPPDSQLRGVGSILGDLSALCGGALLPGRESVTACGNSFGRGPLVCHFPPAVLQLLQDRAVGGDAAAAELEAELCRIAATHMLQHMQGDVQGVVRSYLERHRPLAKYTKEAAAQSRQLPERVARYTAQVLLDLLQTIPTAPLVQLQPGEQYRQAAHLVLLQGCLEPAGGGEELPAPAVLPLITSHRFSFAVAKAVQEQRPGWRAGSAGATLLVCSGS